MGGFVSKFVGEPKICKNCHHACGEHEWVIRIPGFPMYDIPTKVIETGRHQIFCRRYPGDTPEMFTTETCGEFKMKKESP